MSPRPILKSLPPATRPLPSFRAGRVHFPPTPDISATYLTHSGRSYDRSAIVVSPNECALPERNCPERTYVLSESRGEGRLLKSLVLGEPSDEEETPSADPESLQRTDYFSVPLLTPPSLTPDATSSESEESDGPMSPPPNEVEAGRDHPPIPIVTVSTTDDRHTHHALPSSGHVQDALSFLPHPLPPVRERKRSLSPHDRERKKEKANSFAGNSNGFTPSRRRVRSFTPEVPPDLGCLGGF